MSRLRRLIFLLPLLSLVAAPAALDAAPKKKGMAAPQLPTGDMGKKKPKEAAKKAGPASLQQFEQSQFDETVKKLQQRKSELRRKIARKLEDLLARNPYYENKAEVYHRLAETYWQEAKYKFLLAMEEYSKQSDAFEAGTLKTEPVQPMEDFSTALEYYRKVQREFPSYHRIDEVTYYLAKGLLLEGTNKKNPNLVKEGVKNLKKLVKDFPKSRFVSESFLALGEYYFDNNMLFYAKNNYEEIINNYPKSKMYNYALYKLGWVYYNLREFEKSVKTFHAVIEQLGESGSRGRIEFRDQALNDLTRVYAEIDDGWKDARRYFLTKLDEEATYKKLRNLGMLLMGMDKDEEAIALYTHFIEKFPNAKECVEWWENILGIRVEQNLLSQIEEDTRRMLVFLSAKSTWRTANRADPDILDAATRATERRVLWIATRYHQEAQRLREIALYDRAIDLYSVFLKEFPGSKHAYRVNFFLAEILFDQKKDYKAAVVQYDSVLDRDAKGQYTEDAALGAVFCYDELMVKAGLRKRARGKKIQAIKLNAKQLKERQKLKKETPLHELEKGFIHAADTYVSLVTAWLTANPELRKKNPERGAQIPEMMYIAAQMLYDHGDYRGAIKRLKVLFDYNPQHQFAAYSVNLLIDAYAKLRHWEKVEYWADRLIKARNFKVKSRRELNRIRAIAIAERAREMALRKEFSSAVGENMRIVKEFKKSDPELAATALFNVGAIHERARNIPEAIRTYRRVRKQFSKTKIAPKAQFVIGVIYESQTQFAKAAEAFEQMAAFKDRDETADAVRNAGLIWEALGKPKRAIKAYEKFLKLFPKRPDSAAVALRIGVVLQQQGDLRSLKVASGRFLKFARKYKAALPLVVEAYARAGAIAPQIDKRRGRRKALAHDKAAIKAFSDLMAKTPDKVGGAKYFAAQAAFQVADFSYDDFSAVLLDAKTMKNIKLLKQTIVKKANLHQATEKAMQSILDYKEPQWNAAALLRIGQIYYEFARMLLDAPVPEDLPVDVEDAYRFTLEQTAGPIEEKSLTAFGYALRLAHEQKVYNRWSRESARFAAKVNPDEFPVAEEKLVAYDHTRDTSASASFIRFLKRGDIVVNMSK